MNHLQQALCQTQNFQYIHEHLFTSGQLNAVQLKKIKEYGINTVINLALTDAPNHLHNEDKICLDIGLNYIQLPICWELPDAEQALFVLDTIDFLVKDHQVWVHCAQNYRVSALMYLYRQYYMNMDIATAQNLLHQIWTPNDTWTGLIHSVDLLLKGRKATRELEQALFQTQHFV